MIPILKVPKNKYIQEEHGQTLSNDVSLWRELFILSFFYDSSYALLQVLHIYSCFNHRQVWVHFVKFCTEPWEKLCNIFIPIKRIKQDFTYDSL